MKKSFLRFHLLLLFIVFTSFVSAQTLEQKLAEIDAYAQKVQSDWNVPGFAMAIVKDDKVVFAKGYGVRKLSSPEKVDENTLFAIASNSKAFTTASLAILVDEGKLKWDDKVTQYLPDFQMYDAYVTREMTIRDLVSHHSGLDTFSGDLLWYDTTYSADELLKRVRYLKPTSSFRSQFGYQNLMFIAAGKVLEKVSGKTWAQFVRERFLTPLRMDRTTTSVKDIKDNFASPHNESGGKLRPLPLGNVDNSWGACGLNASVAELGNWMRLQLGRGTFEGKQIFSKERSAEMWAQNTILEVNPFPAKNAPTQMFSGYGLGWFITDYRGHKMLYHSGGLDGMISETGLIPDENLGVVVLTNSETG
ncbi:MAG TPA: serine hydrolase domain-containing protein, partial [Pyrinomonadaceae bacterium]|nr:serine hydrolase domain-containing protein [Pyrinomonadaceae bacterium]